MIIPVSEDTIHDGVIALHKSIGYILNEKNDPYLEWDNHTICQILNELSQEMELNLWFYADRKENITIGSDNFRVDFHYFGEFVDRFDKMYPDCLGVGCR